MVAGDVTAFDEPAYRANLAGYLNISSSSIGLTVEAASTRVHSRIVPTVGTTASALVDSLSRLTLSNASLILGANVTKLYSPEIVMEVMPPSQPPGRPPPLLPLTPTEPPRPGSPPTPPTFPPPPYPPPPYVCNASDLTSDVDVSIANEFGASTQLSFASVLSSTNDSSVHVSALAAGTLHTRQMRALTRPTAHTNATLYAYVQSFRWRKEGAFVSQAQTSHVTRPAAVLHAVLRTAKVWVDRPAVYTAYTLQDEDGSSLVDTSGSFAAALNVGNANVNCSAPHMTSAVRDQTRHLGFCRLLLAASSFGVPGADTSPVTMRIASVDGNPLSELSRSLGEVTLAQPPGWWDPTLRTTVSGGRETAP